MSRWEFDESYLKYINGDPEKLDDFLVKEHENIFSFPIFKPSFCETILKVSSFNSPYFDRITIFL